MLSKPATVRSNIPAIQRSLGLTYSKLGRIDEANQASRRALE